MDTSVEVRYAGVVVGRGLVLRDQETEGSFVGIPEPLPVGTRVTLKIGESVREAQVAEVVESSEASAVGMRVRWHDGATESRPAPKPAAAPAPAPEPVAAAPAPAPVQAALSPAPVPDEPASAPVEAAPVSVAAEGPIPAPLSLAGGADSGQVGGKKRRKRR